MVIVPYYSRVEMGLIPVGKCTVCGERQAAKGAGVCTRVTCADTAVRTRSDQRMQGAALHAEKKKMPLVMKLVWLHCHSGVPSARVAAECGS